MKRKQFTFYRSFFNAMSEMDMEERGIAISWVCAFALDGVEPPQMRGNQKIYRDLVQPVLESGRNKALAGSKGGSISQASKQVSKKENEKEKEKENEIETETETNCTKGQDALGAQCLWVGFERFWDAYPVKIGQEEAWEQWQRLCPDPEVVCQSLQKWKLTGQWVKEKGRYVPRAAKFLEQEYYLQVPECAAPKGALGQLGAAEIEAIEKIMREDLHENQRVSL